MLTCIFFLLENFPPVGMPYYNSKKYINAYTCISFDMVQVGTMQFRYDYQAIKNIYCQKPAENICGWEDKRNYLISTVENYSTANYAKNLSDQLHFNISYDNIYLLISKIR